MSATDDHLVRRFVHVLSELDRAAPTAERLCEAARRLLAADGAAITLHSRDDPRMVIAATDELATRLQDVQDVAGEGPSVDAQSTGTVIVARLEDDGDGDGDGDVRWSILHEHARDLAPVGAIVAAPLLGEHAPIGVLTAHRSSGPLQDDPRTAEFLGHAVGAALFHNSGAALGVPDVAASSWAVRAEVHQATGMVVAQVGVHPVDALALLKGQAFAQNISLSEVAQQLIRRDINFRNFTIEGD